MSITTTSTRWVGGCATVAMLPMIIVHVIGADAVDPIFQPVSHYVYVPGGYLMVLLGSVALATAALALARGLGRAGLSAVALPQQLLISFAVAMVLVGLLPTDPPGTIALGASATIHRWSAAYAFAVLPVIGFVVVGRSAASGASVDRVRLRRLSVGVTAGVGTFFAIHLPMLALGSQIPLFGLVERIGFVVMVSFMVVLSLATRPALLVGAAVHDALPESAEVRAAVLAAGAPARDLASGHRPVAGRPVAARVSAAGRPHPVPGHA